ncbi:MAG: SIS domain-containing protein, partial [Candidatus Thorarchaeota archaeon]|nr:SIS domain-containing protein [Candidatus Thorarchaeota archaeon]
MERTNTMKLPSSIKPDNMKNLVTHFPQLLSTLQIESSILNTAREFHKEGLNGICFLGMGGSSIAGNYARALLSKKLKIPISVTRDYLLPTYVDDKWVVIAISYSGNTEETLSSLSMANEIGSRIILMTSGGKMAQESKHPIIHLPDGLQPRAALPLIFSAVLPIVESLAGLKITNFQYLEEVLIKKSNTWNEWLFPPKEIAESFIEKTPLFIGSRHLAPVAYRAKCQINENSKALAFHSELPESNHNEIESFVKTNGCSVLPVFLRSGLEPTKINRRFDVTYDMYLEMGLSPINLLASGDTRLEEML